MDRYSSRSIDAARKDIKEGMDWDKATLEKFRLLIGKMPVFVRGTAEQRVSEKAQGLARAGGRPEVSEKDMVDAFFAQTPFGFQGLMKNDLSAVGIDYTKYGYTDAPVPGRPREERTS